MSEERSAPRGLGVEDGAADDLRGQSPYGAAGAVDEAGAAGEVFPSICDARDVAGGLAQPARAEHLQFGIVAETRVDHAAQTAGDGTRIEFRLDYDAPGHEMETAGDPEHRGHLGRLRALLLDRHVRQLVLHLGRQSHVVDLLTSATRSPCTAV